MLESLAESVTTERRKDLTRLSVGRLGYMFGVAAAGKMVFSSPLPSAAGAACSRD